MAHDEAEGASEDGQEGAVDDEGGQQEEVSMAAEGVHALEDLFQGTHLRNEEDGSICTPAVSP